MAVKIEHRIGIAAPANIIWEVMFDVSAWTQWSAIYAEATGEVRFGGSLALTLALPDHPPRPVKATILDWTPDEAIHWKTKGFLMETTRYLEIEKLAETGCLFSNGEIFSGFGTRYLSRSRLRDLREGYGALGEGLKARAEALWRARADEPALAL
ncbi:SRPBCC domain-containing protein [Phenylobacterium montanum]|uniref:SRPBCC domain-containing protein n=1 Tax=Phenylobacterium montanum TaxID=2823693 RepID=A0A975IT50_9CAUL|nr:SRPBCC domain-containing protein [Caulobacter sp. S6]QUD86355.1 SRPBCC domain-containing protein [Caulobacter sp. S6]